MQTKDRLIVAKEFSTDPGARQESDGINSGDRFFNELLRPRFLEAKRNNYKLLVDLDGVFGYPSSFVSGSFGRLSMEFGDQEVLKHLDFKSDRRPIRIEKIIYEIKHPEKERI